MRKLVAGFKGDKTKKKLPIDSGNYDRPVNENSTSVNIVPTNIFFEILKNDTNY